MEGKGRIYCRILTFVYAAWLSISCGISVNGPESRSGTVGITIELAGTDIMSKSGDDYMADVSLIVFNQDGSAERCLIPEMNESPIMLDLVSGRSYSFYAVANFGYHVFAEHISEMEELTYHIGSPDIYSTKAPMSGCLNDISISADTLVRIPLRRLGAHISIEMDRSRLEDDVIMEVTGIRIGNSPKQVKVFGESRIGRQEECFEHGFSLYGPDVSPLNLEDDAGRSGEIALYMLENMQGELSDLSPETDSEKVFHEGDPRQNTCSYIEIQLKYLSYSHFSSEGPLVYRFYLGDGPDNVDVERNCRYRICVSPEGNGLTEDSWRVDKTYMHEFGPSGLASFPESYIRGDIGDTLHLYCEFYPPHTPFEIDMEELEYDRKQGIYDYIIDEDGQGVRLILTGSGTGIVYMEAGEPVNDAAMWVVEVNLPSSGSIASECRPITDTLQYMSPCKSSTAPEFPQRPDVRLHRLLQGRGRSPSPPHG